MEEAMGKDIHVVAHTHWDREWYFTTSRSKVYLQKDLSDVLDVLDADPEFKTFLLDGQSCLLDDYLAWKPDDEPRVRRLVSDGRLVVGPWYTQTDQMVISGESIVRNLFYGMRRADEFGHCMMVGYVPDSFGQAGNMPQIYRQFGIGSTLFWRGVSDDMVRHTDFTWRGDDGSTVLATQIPNGYYIGGNMPEAPEDAREFWQRECLGKAGGRTATDNVYFPVGFDQAPVRENLVELVRRQAEADPENTYHVSGIEEYMADLASSVHDLEEVDGELLVGKQMRIHRSIFSSRSDLKALNTRLQFYVANVMEPLLLVSASQGNEYPAGTVAAIWKLLFENAAHDSIGSSVSDSVNADVRMRYKQANDMATSLVELNERLVATNVAGNEDAWSYTVFNTLPVRRDAVLVDKLYVPGEPFEILDDQGSPVPYTLLEHRDLTDYVLAQTIRLDPSRPIEVPKSVSEATLALDMRDVPAMGYERLTIRTGASSARPLRSIDALENEHYRVEVNDDGSLRITCKDNGMVYEHEAVLVESGDDGDSFNYSPPRRDLHVRSSDFVPSVRMRGSDVFQKASVLFEMEVPHDLGERAQGICSDKMRVVLEVSLAAGSETIGLTVQVDNRGPLSHRLCILFDSQLSTKVNYADEQFGCIRRDNVHDWQMELYHACMDGASSTDERAVGELPANWSQATDSWQEMPVSIEPTQSYVSLCDESGGIAVFPQGVREYEIVDDDLEEGGRGNVISLTLFRTYGFMGKEDLLYRPGRASGEKTIKTPEAQLQTTMTYDLGFSAFAGPFDDGSVAMRARSFDTPLDGFEYAPFLNGRLMFSEREVEGSGDTRGSLFQLEGGLVPSAIKKAESRPGLVVRLYNGSYQLPESGRLVFPRKVAKASYVDLREEDVSAAPVEDGHVVVVEPIGHCKFVSLYVELEDD
jgi:mannosylglycerate hydrolase